MENVVLIIHLLLALGLIAVVLMQRSEGGGLGMGGGGGGAMTGRAAATALGKVTWILAATAASLLFLAGCAVRGSAQLQWGGRYQVLLQPFLVVVSVHVVALCLYLLDRFSPFGKFHHPTTAPVGNNAHPGSSSGR